VPGRFLVYGKQGEVSNLFRTIVVLVQVPFGAFYTMTSSLADRGKIVELYLKLGSIVEAQRAFRRETGLRKAPSKKLN